MSASKVERTAEDVERRVARAIWDAHKALTWPAHPAHDGTTAYVKIPLEMAACESLARAALEAMGASIPATALTQALDMVVDACRDGTYSVSEFNALKSLTTGGNDGE